MDLQEARAVIHAADAVIAEQFQRRMEPARDKQVRAEHLAFKGRGD